MKLTIKNRLIWGFFVTVLILVTAVSMSIWKVSEIDEISTRIAVLRTPTAQNSAEMLNDVNGSLAALRGYMLTGEERFKLTRADVWLDIDKTRINMDNLSENWTNPANVEKWAEFKQILSEFRVAQARVEEISQTEDEQPATKILVNEAVPLAALLMDTISTMITMEQQLPASEERKKLLGVMADTRASVASGLANIRAFLLTGDEQFKNNFDIFWNENSVNFMQLKELQYLLSPDQLAYFEEFSEARNKFAPLPNRMITIRSSEQWNMANYLLLSEAVPRADRLLNMLLGFENNDGERIGGMVRDQQRLLDIDGLSNSEAVNALLLVEWILLIIGVVLGAIIAFYVTRSIIIPINSMTSAMRRISAGELDVDIPALESTDEIGSMAKAVQVFKANAVEVRRYVEEDLEFHKHALDEHSIVSIADVRGDITYVNDKFCQISGYSRKELLENNHRIVKSDEHDKEFFVNMWKTIAKGDTWKGEIKNFSKDGSPYWVKTTIVPNLNAAGKPFQYIGIRTEITEDKLKEMELITLSKDLSKAKNKSERAAATKSEFLAAMSHEIRTPMAGVIGMADLILNRELEPQVKDWTRSIKSSGNQLMAILNEILDQSKLDAGKIVVDPTEFHLASFVKNTTDLFLPKFATKGLTLNTKIDEKIPEGVYADPLRITQVLSNLLSNALKFTNTGGIDIIIEREPIKGDKFTLSFTVLDSGIGLSKTAQENIFNPFTQADYSTSRKYGGTGLGLSISKQLVELMGGEIRVSSVEGIGSRFWFTVTSRAAKGDVELFNTFAPEVNWQTSRSLKILVAEDTDYIREMVREILKNLNHKATLVNDGKQAVEALEEEDFDLILMDIRMPVMDGLEATALIRSMEGEKSNIPIIALTADVTTEKLSGYRKKGMDEICAKPIELPMLLKTINSLLGDEIHIAIDKIPPQIQNQQASNEEFILELPVIDGSFSQVLERASKIADQLNKKKENGNTPLVKMGAIPADKVFELQKKYVKKLKVNCANLKAAIDSLADSPADEEIKNKAITLAHSMKGGGSSYGYNLVTKIAGELDNILITTDNLEAHQFSTLNNHVDALSLIAKKKISGEGGEAGHTLLQGLQVFVNT